MTFFFNLSHVMSKSVFPYANNKGADQTARISTLVVRRLDSIIPLLAISKILRPWLVS